MRHTECNGGVRNGRGTFPRASSDPATGNESRPDPGRKVFIDYAMLRALDWSERGFVPDTVIRLGIRRLLRHRLREVGDCDSERADRLHEAFRADMAGALVAITPDKANEQHYEVPPEFFEYVLGKHRKYSCCLWNPDTRRLDDAEAAALAVTCERAQLADGMRVLELGCGWGSLSLWMAAHYPRSAIIAVSNSRSQADFIESQARRRRLSNLRIVTVDMNEFAISQRFDRVISVEMFEHMRNWQELLRRVHGWLAPGGQLFMHFFCHRSTPYAFADAGVHDWMARHFFTGGIMPSDDLPLWFQEHLRVERRWRWSGTHYQQTANAWLANLDANRGEVWPLLEDIYGAQAVNWFGRWRMFFIACAELFGYQHGQAWWVSHYRFARREDAVTGDD